MKKLKCFYDDLRWHLDPFFEFIKLIHKFYVLYRDYGYAPDELLLIMSNYSKILINRTKDLSKLTYDFDVVINAMDEWYENKNA